MPENNEREKFFQVLRNCDTSTLYMAAVAYARKHKNHLNQNGCICIDKTSATIMGNMLARTSLTPEGEVEAMREKRKEALEAFCYIYGGYIAHALGCLWRKNEYWDIPEKEVFLSEAAGQVVESLIRALDRSGYKQGKFNHLVRTSIKNKFADVGRKYRTWCKNNGDNYSLQGNEEDDAVCREALIVSDDPFLEEEEEKKSLDIAGFISFIRQVRIARPDDCEMFIRNRIKKQRLADIAEEFHVSTATVSNRVNAFAIIAYDAYQKMKKDMERY